MFDMMYIYNAIMNFHITYDAISNFNIYNILGQWHFYYESCLSIEKKVDTFQLIFLVNYVIIFIYFFLVHQMTNPR